MFVFKKIVSPMFLPLPLCVEILLVGIILLWFTRKQRAGKLAVSLAAMMLLLFSNHGVADRLLRPLESRYPPLAARVEGQAGKPAASPIVVLAAGFAVDPRLPPSSQLSHETMVRLAEGIRLYRERPGSKLVLSGGAWLDPVPEAEIMARVAEALGTSRRDIVLESESRDTEDEARLLQPTLGSQPFVLVTSAAHMPRSMALFRKLGMKPIAAPADFLVTHRSFRITPETVYPNSKALQKSEVAVYERLGLAWAKLRGKI